MIAERDLMKAMPSLSYMANQNLKAVREELAEVAKSDATKKGREGTIAWTILTTMGQ